MLLRGPSDAEFTQIFERACAARRIPHAPGLLDRFLDKHFRQTAKPLRRCQPRDLLFHAINLIHFEKLPYVLNDEILDRAFESCFVEEEEAPAQQIVPPLDPATQAARIPTLFGRLTFLAGRQEESAPKLHMQAFRDWLGLTLAQQSRDLTDYVAVSANRAAISGNLAGVVEWLTPAGCLAAETALFAHGLNTLLDMRNLIPGMDGNLAAA
jgi:hypothetical protein